MIEQALYKAKRLPKNQTGVKQFALNEISRILQDADVEDPRLPVSIDNGSKQSTKSASILRGKPRGRTGRTDLIPINPEPLIQYRQENQLSYRAFAKKIGLSASLLARIANGQVTKVDKNSLSLIQSCLGENTLR